MSTRNTGSTTYSHLNETCKSTLLENLDSMASSNMCYEELLEACRDLREISRQLRLEAQAVRKKHAEYWNKSTSI